MLLLLIFYNYNNLGLIHANHGESIKEYLLQQLKNATTDVCFSFHFKLIFLSLLQNLTFSTIINNLVIF